MPRGEIAARRQQVMKSSGSQGEPHAKNEGGQLSGRPRTKQTYDCQPALEVELQRKLDLPRVVGTVAGGRNGPEGRGGFVVGITRQREVRMVANVEEFGAEFQASLLRGLELLEQRVIEPMESGADDLRGAAAQWRVIALPDSGGRRGIG